MFEEILRHRSVLQRTARRPIGPKDHDPTGCVAFGLHLGESQFKITLDTLKALGVEHSVNHAPCSGKGAIGKDDAIQKAMSDFGHNITSHCTTGIDIGPLCLVFFTGAGDMVDVPGGTFLFTLNSQTREIVHNTHGLKVVCPEPEADDEEEDA